MRRIRAAAVGLALVSCAGRPAPLRSDGTNPSSALAPTASMDGGSGESSSPPMAPAPAAPIGLPALTAMDTLPLLRLSERAGHSSSYDRKGGNSDSGNGLGTDGSGDLIVLDQQGPGCVYRIWFTGFETSQTIHVYFDGESTPRIDLPLEAFFSGTTSPFLTPLVGNALVSSGGFYSYVPLPYAKALRITVTPGNYYYNIDYHALPVGAAVSSWTGNEDSSAARAVWGAAGQDPKPDPGDVSSDEAMFDLPPGVERVLFEDAGPAQVSSVELRVPSISPAAAGGTNAASAVGLLDQLWVTMFWDDEVEPSVSAPIGALFGLGDFGAGVSGGLAAGLRADGTLYLYFPMPFARHARVSLDNRGAAAATGLWARVRHRPFAFEFDDVGTFAARYTPAVSSTQGRDLTLLDVTGSGQIVGVVLSERRSACSGCKIRDYLEGDERAVVDGLRTPVVQGTGTEDFFNAGYYFKYGPFGLSSHGNVVHESQSAYDGTSAYRFFLSDPIPFRDGGRLSIQHGPADDDQVTAWSLVYYYRQARARLAHSDSLTVGDSASEAAHDYTITGATWSGSVTATFEGENDTESVAATGRALEANSDFVMRVDPTNRGVMLRRLLDQSVGNQRAEVYVDGAFAGEWLTAGSNEWHAWREDDFLVDPELSADKTQVHVEIRFVSSDSVWNEFTYESLSILP